MLLVLSRRLSEKVIFPGLDISVQVVGLTSGRVRLGIDAPANVTIIREELPDRVAEWDAASPLLSQQEVQARLYRSNKGMRNRLKSISADLKLLRRQLEAGLTTDACVTLEKIEEQSQPVSL